MTSFSAPGSVELAVQAAPSGSLGSANAAVASHPPPPAAAASKKAEQAKKKREFDGITDEMWQETED